MSFDLSHKPEPTLCPRAFCFFWRMGRVISAHSPEPQTVAEGCCHPFWRCTRLDTERGQQDGYEDHRPNLEDAGLPWFYFYPSSDRLVPELRERYIKEPEVLWGKEHWKSEDGERT